MCGVAGVFHKQAEQDVEMMLRKLIHRGSNGQVIKNLPSATLGHIRLATIDSESEQQPVGREDTWITFDGEIYNNRELTREYLNSEPLQTRSDAEVVLYLYRKLGPRCVELLDGTFAFAVVDGKEFFMARDALGIKPVYCGTAHHAFYFASEIKALSEITNTIHEFPPGHWFHSRMGWHAYFNINWISESVHSETDAIKSLRTVLQEAVRKRSLSEAPVGVSLSGDMESSIIAMLIKQENTQVQSFSVGEEGSEDLAATRKIAATLGVQHHEHAYTQREILGALPKIVYHLESFDPTLVRSAIPNFFLAELASQYVKVILTSEGAAEICAGHDYLGSIESHEELQNELINITSSLHNTELQRTDRIHMAFGLTARVPFLDMKLMTLAWGLPAKHILWRAFRDDFPKEILNSQKQKYSKETGASDMIIERAEHEVSDTEFHSESTRLLNRWGYRLPNKETLFYYRILRQYYEDRWIFPIMGFN